MSAPKDAADYVRQYEQLVLSARSLPDPQPASARPAVGAAAPVCVVLSPHPDDEVLQGGLALRLARERGWRVVNLAVTLGSNKARQLARAGELERACAALGFDSRVLGGGGLQPVSLVARQTDVAHWANSVKLLARELSELRPALVLCPHDGDAQPAHAGTHALLVDALVALGSGFRCLLAWHEYWSTMAQPNLLVQLSADHAGMLVNALMHHRGEIARNPYHLSLPAWLHDNVRRAGERVAGAGMSVPDWTFGVPCDIQQWGGRLARPVWSGGRLWGLTQTCPLPVPREA